MSIVDPVDIKSASQTFSQMVVPLYENMQRLQGVIWEDHGLTGPSNYPIEQTIGSMSTGNFGGGDIPVQGAPVGNITLQPIVYHLKTVVPTLRQSQLAYNDLRRQARYHARAAARQIDRIKLNSVFTYAAGQGTQTTETFNEVPEDSTPSGITVKKLTDALDILGDADADEQLSIAYPKILKGSLMQDPKFSSWDYNVERPLMNGRLSSYLDMVFLGLGNRGANALPFDVISSGVRGYKLPVFDHESTVFGVWENIYTTITPVENQRRVEIVTTLVANSKVLKTDGIVLINAQVAGSTTSSALRSITKNPMEIDEAETALRARQPAVNRPSPKQSAVNAETGKGGDNDGN